MAKSTKKVVKRTVLKKFTLPVAGATLKKLAKAYEANGGKGNINTFAAKCLAKGIAGIS